jgi:hypothetical protein
MVLRILSCHPLKAILHFLGTEKPARNMGRTLESPSLSQSFTTCLKQDSAGLVIQDQQKREGDKPSPKAT